MNNDAVKFVSYCRRQLELQEASKPSFVRKISHYYEDNLIDFKGMPDEVFNFFLDLLSEEYLYSLPGVWNFVLAMSTEGHRLKSFHYKIISNTILENYSNYKDDQLCLTVCDFIEKNCDPKMAKNILLKLKQIDEENNRDAFAETSLCFLDSRSNNND